MIEEGSNKVAKEIFRQCKNGQEVFFELGKDDKLIMGIRGNDGVEKYRLYKCMDRKIVNEGNDPDGAIRSILMQCGMEVDRLKQNKTVDEYYGTEEI